MYKVVISDLDGTLFNSKYKITNYTKKIIHLLVSKGIKFIIATGRHYIDLIDLKNMLNLNSYLITSNGSRIYDLKGDLIFDSFLENNVVDSLLKIKKNDEEITTQVYTNNSWYINSNKYNNNFCKKLSLKYKFLDFFTFSFNKVNKIFFTSSNIRKLKNLKKEITFLWGDKRKINIFFSFPECLEIVPYEVSKGKSLIFISKLLDISTKNFISFGDGMNDKDMLEISGKGCIMGNADSKLKKELNLMEIIGTNEQDGVASYLNSLFSL
ncbi:Pyridoxal phosphate phosphatase YigL [Buchnera aphidicola (Tetraneura ulmi)]|uniref:Cof-type HAD-IIB family hydrolase n=1 Tax=Buchnera aphidicola TaxID=9 RepID=UPI00346465AF